MSKMTKTQAALETARTAKQNLSRKLESEKQEGVRKGSLFLSGFGIGALERNGRMADLPAMGPIPKTGWFVLIPGAIAFFSKPGLLKSITNGSADAAIGVTGYKLGTGQSMSGASSYGDDAEEIARMERNLARRRSGRRPERDDDGDIEGIDID